MITEVQITNSYSHSIYLRKIINCVCAQIGMGSKEIEDTENAVKKICTGSLTKTHDGSLNTVSVKLAAHDTYMTVDVTDHLSHIDSPNGELLISNEYMRNLEGISALTDAMEIIGADNGVTVRITKYACKPQVSLPHLNANIMGTATLQA